MLLDKHIFLFARTIITVSQILTNLYKPLQLMESLANLDEIIASVRVDKATRFAAITDIVQLFGISDKNAARVYHDLPEAIKSKCRFMPINNIGRDMYCAPCDVLLEVIWVIPAKRTQEFRSECAKTICRVLGGDLTLAEQIERRHATISEPERSFFMAPATQPPPAIEAPHHLIVGGQIICTVEPWMTPEIKNELMAAYLKRIKEYGAECDAKRMKLQREQIDIAERMQAHPSVISVLRDQLFNDVKGLRPLQDASQEIQYLEISSLCRELGFKGFMNSDLVRIGQRAAKTCKELFPDRVIAKQIKLVDGKNRQVNCYEESDKPWLCDIIKEHFTNKQ